jgi:hypothetical protein
MGHDVEFTARLDGGAVVWDSSDGKPAKDHRVEIGHGEPPQRIQFKIKDHSGLKLQFDTSAPIDVWERSGCPPPGIDTDQIEVIDCNPNMLTVRSLNSGDARTLQYQLNVVASDGSKQPCDPIITNGGGGRGVE